MRYRIDYEKIDVPPHVLEGLPSATRTHLLRISTEDGARFVIRAGPDADRRPVIEWQSSESTTNVLEDLVRDANEAADLRAQVAALQGEAT